MRAKHLFHVFLHKLSKIQITNSKIENNQKPVIIFFTIKKSMQSFENGFLIYLGIKNDPTMTTNLDGCILF